MVEYIPDRGDIIWLEFDPQKGKEPKKKRPALVVSPKSYNSKTGLTFVFPMTSKKKDYPFEVEIKYEKVQGVILSDQLKSFDWRGRKAQFISKATDEVIYESIEKFKVLLK